MLCGSWGRRDMSCRLGRRDQLHFGRGWSWRAKWEAINRETCCRLFQNELLLHNLWWIKNYFISEIKKSSSRSYYYSSTWTFPCELHADIRHPSPQAILAHVSANFHHRTQWLIPANPIPRIHDCLIISLSGPNANRRDLNYEAWRRNASRSNSDLVAYRPSLGAKMRSEFWLL